MVWLYILIAVVTFIFCIWTIFHMPRLGCFNLVTGGVKCGKSMFSVWLVRKKYKRAMLRWFWNCIKAKITRKPLPERPLVYSNIPLRIPYVPFSTMNALRKKRFRYGSVLFIDEASLFSDSQLIKDEDRNLQLMLFNKLIGHELHGGSGTIIYNTQCIQDFITVFAGACRISFIAKRLSRFRFSFCSFIVTRRIVRICPRLWH